MSQGWKDPRGDAHFEQQRNRADTANPKQQKLFFTMMQNIGEEMQRATSSIRLKEAHPIILDVCAAPGGFVRIALDQNPSARVYALSLPKDLGGHPFLVNHGKRDPRVRVQFVDITRLGLEYGLAVDELDADMTSERPYPDLQCDLVFCDGQVLRTNESHRNSNLERHAATRLTYSQLILAMKRLKPGGTLIMLLHKADAWNTFELLVTFAEFSELQVFKPSRCHATRSSFYLVARDVRSECTAARLAVEKWKRGWRYTTIDSDSLATSIEPTVQDREAMEKILETLGEEFVHLLAPIWDIQRDAIEKAPWFSTSNTKSDTL